METEINIQITQEDKFKEPEWIKVLTKLIRENPELIQYE